MEDFDILVKEAKGKGLRIIMDFVPNHSSNEHEWFLKSEQREDPYTDYYVWRDRNESNPGQKCYIHCHSRSDREYQVAFPTIG